MQLQKVLSHFIGYNFAQLFSLFCRSIYISCNTTCRYLVLFPELLRSFLKVLACILKLFLNFFSNSIRISCLILKLLMYFEFFFYKMRARILLYFYLWISSFPAPFVEESVFSPGLDFCLFVYLFLWQSQGAIDLGISFWLLYSIPLIDEPSCVPEPFCSRYCGL